MIISIHQPEAFPQLGYFSKILKSDTFIFLDHVDYRKNYFQNRNKIMTVDGIIWLTLPIASTGKKINEKKIKVSFARKIIKSIELNYQKSVQKSLILNFIENEFNQKDEICLANFNINFIKLICDLLSINCKFEKSSHLNLQESKSSLILEICKKVDCNVYLSGISGRDYLDLNEFENAEIKILFQKFNHIQYHVDNREFVPYMSVLAPLLTIGPKKTMLLIDKGSDYV